MVQTYRAFLHGKISVIRAVILCVWFSLVSLYPGNVPYTIRVTSMQKITARKRGNITETRKKLKIDRNKEYQGGEK